MTSEDDDLDSLFKISEKDLKKAEKSGRSGRNREAALLICTVQKIAFRGCPSKNQHPWHFFLTKEAERLGNPVPEAAELAQEAKKISGNVMPRGGVGARGTPWPHIVRVLGVQARDVEEYQVLRRRVGELYEASFKKPPPRFSAEEVEVFGQADAIEDLVAEIGQLRTQNQELASSHEEIQKRFLDVARELEGERKKSTDVEKRRRDELTALRESFVVKTRSELQFSKEALEAQQSAQQLTSDLTQKLGSVSEQLLVAQNRLQEAKTCRGLLMGLIEETADSVARLSATLELHGAFTAEIRQFLPPCIRDQHRDMFPPADPAHRALSRYLSIHHDFLRAYEEDVSPQTVAERAEVAEEVIERLMTAHGPLPRWDEFERRARDLLKLNDSLGHRRRIEFMQFLYDSQNAAVTTAEDTINIVYDDLVRREPEVEQQLDELDSLTSPAGGDQRDRDAGRHDEAQDRNDEVLPPASPGRRLWLWWRRQRMQKRIARATQQSEKLLMQAEQLKEALAAQDLGERDRRRAAEEQKQHQLRLAEARRQDRAQKRIIRRERRTQEQLWS